MKKEELNTILKITTVVAVVIFMLVLIKRNDLSFAGVLRSLSITVTILVVLWGLFFKFGWKFPVLKNIVLKENINGSWYGNYKSISAITGEEYEGVICIVIRQSFLTLNIKSYTEKYISFSFGEALLSDRERDKHLLVYLYSQNEFNPDDDTVRKGASELNLQKDSTEEMLFGDFWTNDNTKGNIKLRKVTSKHLRSFTEISQLHNK